MIKDGGMTMKKIISVFLFTLIIISLFDIYLSENAKAENAGALEKNLKEYLSKKIPDANITSAKVVKLGDIRSVTRQEFLTDNIKEDLERPVLVKVKGKCIYSDKTIDEDIELTLHKDKWGDWAPGQGTQSHDSLLWGMVGATLQERRCPENPIVVKQRVKEKENAEEAFKSEAKRRVAIVSEIKKIAERIPEKEWNLLWWVQINKNVKIGPTCNNPRCLRDLYYRADTLLDDIELKKYNGLGSEESLTELLNVVKGYNLDDMKRSLMRKKAVLLEIKAIENQISFSEWNHLYAAKFSKNNDIMAMKCSYSKCVETKEYMRTLYSYAEQFDVNNLFNEQYPERIGNLYRTSDKGISALLEILQEYKGLPIRSVNMAPTGSMPIENQNEEQVNQHKERSVTYFNNKQYQLAIEVLNEAIRLKPDDADAYSKRGVAYFNLGQYQLAIENYNEAIRLKPDLAKAYNNRGNAYFAQGNYNLGCNDAQKACSLGICNALEGAKSRGDCR